MTFFIAIGIFAIAYAIIISEKIHRTVIALIGASLMIILGVISQEQAIEGVDFNTLGLLIGMMVIVDIAKQYKPEELIGREIAVMANLESRVLFGLESQGMLLAAGGSDGPVLLRPNQEVLPGARVG